MSKPRSIYVVCMFETHDLFLSLHDLLLVEGAISFAKKPALGLQLY